MSYDITKLDNNFSLETQITKDGLKFYNILQNPFKIYGVIRQENNFFRMPKEIAKTVSQGVEDLNFNTAGGRVKFKTNSKRISIISKQNYIGKMPHFAYSGSIGFDLYVKKNDEEIYSGSFIPSIDIVDGFESTLNINNDEICEFTINFPLYSGVMELLIGLDDDAVLCEPDEYSITKPIVYYGSSITQGGCASRPGNSYQAIISREFNCDYINLGFSGNARAEDEMIDYIKKLEMSIFVYDYDHNAPTVKHLESTHEKSFKEIRNQNPLLPIIILSRPKYNLLPEEITRLEIIRSTYQNALKSGDKNVYLIEGKQLMENAKDNGTVDDCHPNDFGFYSMANALIKVIKDIV